MTGFITAEGLVIPAGSDVYDYVNDQRRLAASVRSIVPAADQATGDVIAAAMATDGRPVSDSNPLVIWQADQQAINIKGSTGWHPKYTFLSPPVLAGWTLSSGFYLLPFGDRTLVTATISMQRTGTAVSCPGGGVAFTSLGVIAPSQCMTSIGTNIEWTGYISGSGSDAAFEFIYAPLTGTISARGANGTTSSFVTNGITTFQLTYMV